MCVLQTLVAILYKNKKKTATKTILTTLKAIILKRKTSLGEMFFLVSIYLERIVRYYKKLGRNSEA